MDQHTILKQYFGHTRFRPGQEALLQPAGSGQQVEKKEGAKDADPKDR